MSELIYVAGLASFIAWIVLMFQRNVKNIWAAALLTIVLLGPGRVTTAIVVLGSALRHYALHAAKK